MSANLVPEPGMPSSPAAEFDALLADAQPRLKGYVASLLGAWSDVDDLVQETNLVLLHKRDEFVAGTNFIAWAFRVAFFKATSWRRIRQREGRVMLGETAFQMVAAHAEVRFGQGDPLVDALEDCLKGLSPEERRLVTEKYVERRSLAQQATRLECSANSLHKSISRIRLVLRLCINRKLSRQDP
ncbi:sigma-70 family RNA polymerase sigma factor [Luteolibacter arcticus]|uniref:Sigma-70 family RNA polymerase sigma factor n=1 Tax=Luteolibacter arcticus TaxID=1581411 RepID=A0ABT3GLC0_9BACT|nr:sigma-70 family RNA polymerase sigma factor [Luteolibacter arcticus]MCW1924324.1 sigma-70 family RNA polymerase sigma factor [Luteolibacter arcticus]